MIADAEAVRSAGFSLHQAQIIHHSGFAGSPLILRRSSAMRQFPCCLLLTFILAGLTHAADLSAASYASIQDALNANPGRMTCSRYALSTAGMDPSHSG